MSERAAEVGGMTRRIGELLERSRAQAAAAEAQVASLLSRIEAAEKQWRCFGCGFVTSDEAAAGVHFGEDEGDPAICKQWVAFAEDERAAAWEGAEQQLAGERNEIIRLLSRIERLEGAGQKLLDAYGEAHALYDLGECDGSLEMRAALAHAERGEEGKKA